MAFEAPATPLDELPAWKELQAHAAQLRERSLAELFADDPGREQAMHIEAEGMYFDFAKQRATPETIGLLVELARQAGLPERIEAMFAGEKINVSEDRSVLHVALRAPRGERLDDAQGHDVVPDVHEVLDRMAAFSDQVRSGEWLGATGKRIRNVVNIGIGGSDLGPAMATIALTDYTDPEMRFAFVSNIDGSDFADKTRQFDPAETLFVVVSKTFTTLETLTNARTARDWIVSALGEDAVERHFVAVSTNEKGVEEFGIDPANMFGFWEWVGGRYSMDSSVGLSLMVAIGPERFHEMLAGFHAMDEHLRSTPLEQNLPVIFGLLSVWNTSILGCPTVAVLPYAQELSRFPAYLQQLEMESNGKHVMLDGRPVRWATAPVLWGEPGTNGQHAFYQMIHQGTEIVPSEFIGFSEPLHPLGEHHDMLIANMFAQAEALAFGRSAKELEEAGSPPKQVPHRVCEGGRQSTTILVDGPLTPKALGSLIALYEHRVLTEGVCWGIDSFDQWGVELGKVLATKLISELTSEQAPPPDHDASTVALVRRYRELRGRAT